MKLSIEIEFDCVDKNEARLKIINIINLLKKYENDPDMLSLFNA